MKQRLIYTIIAAAVYPLIFGIIFLVAPLMSRTSNQELSFIFISCMIFSIVISVLSMIVAHSLFRQWWLGLIACVVGLLLIRLCYLGYNIYEHNRPEYNEYSYESDGKTIKETGYCIGSKKHGTFTYYRDGSIEKTETFRRNAINGPIHLYYPNGQLKAEGTLRPNTPNDSKGVSDGRWSYYFENGELADRRRYRRGTLLSSERYTLCYDTARLVISIADRRPYTGTLNHTGVVGDGLFPMLVTARVVEGNYEGAVTQYFNFDDTLRIASHGIHVLGQLEGPFTTYHENGQIRFTATFRKGKYEGLYTEYYADSIANRPYGTTRYTCNYESNERHGTARWYYRNGALNTEEPYVNGKSHGIQREYSEDGTIISETRYVNNEIQEN